MKKIIKQIIREEIDSDWSFVNDLPSTIQGGTQIYFDPKPTKEEWDKIATILDNDGWVWSSSQKVTNWSPLRLWGSCPTSIGDSVTLFLNHDSFRDIKAVTQNCGRHRLPKSTGIELSGRDLI